MTTNLVISARNVCIAVSDKPAEIKYTWKNSATGYTYGASLDYLLELAERDIGPKPISGNSAGSNNKRKKRHG